MPNRRIYFVGQSQDVAEYESELIAKALTLMPGEHPIAKRLKLAIDLVLADRNARVCAEDLLSAFVNKFGENPNTEAINAQVFFALGEIHWANPVHLSNLDLTPRWDFAHSIVLQPGFSYLDLANEVNVQMDAIYERFTVEHTMKRILTLLSKQESGEVSASYCAENTVARGDYFELAFYALRGNATQLPILRMKAEATRAG